MIVLGIEGTAHTFGVGIITEKGKELANERDIYKPKEGWGIIPSDAARHHKKVSEEVISSALEKAGITLKEVDGIAISIGPGLPPCLLEGIKIAKKLAEESKKPLIGINHCIAHIEIAKLYGKMKDPLTVYVSGGNTQIIGYEAGRYRVFGETLDIGIGNAIDKFAREKGIGFPGGPKIEKLAKKGKEYIPLPYTVKGMDLVFSGVVTAALKKKAKIEDLCYSFQETIFSMLVEVTERALAHSEKKEVILTGGVAQNKRLQEMLKKMSEEHNAKFLVPKKEVCGDNGLMIAWAGVIALTEKKKLPEIDIKPRWRTDEVEW